MDNLSMLLTTRTASGIQIVSPHGRIDHATADDLLRALEPFLADGRPGSPALIVDLAAVDYISSAGLRVLIVASRRAGSQGGRFAVAGMQPLVQEVFAIARVNLIMPCYVDVDAACANLP